jgi:hypothetical protein
MAKTTQGNTGKQKVSLTPVKALSNMPAKPELIAPVAVTTKTVAPTATAPGAPKTVVRAGAVSAPAVATPAVARFAAAAPEAAKIAIAKPVAVMLKSVAVSPKAEPKPVVAPVPNIPAVAPAPKAAKAPAAPTLSLSIVPVHPGFTDFDAEMWFAPTLNAFRAIAAIQVKVLDHACAELKASLVEAEALVRAASPSEAMALQGKAFSRRLDASSTHIADLAMTARKTGKAA